MATNNAICYHSYFENDIIMKKYNRNGRNTSKAKKWRLEVLNKDNFKCVKCGSTKSLCAHHIKDWNNNIELRYDINNGETLCRSCHMSLHKNKKGSTGHKAWNKGLKGLSTGWPKGKKFSEEHKEKLRKAKTAYIPWNKGKQNWMSEETQKLNKERFKGKKWIIDPISNKRKWID